MICKKCGAYNPDHATFCNVCAADLKDQTDADNAAEVAEAEEVIEKELRPRQGKVKAPDFSRRADSFKAPLKLEELTKDPDEDEEKVEEEEKPAKKAFASRDAAPVQKRRVLDEGDEEDEEDEDDYDEEEEVKPAKKSLFSRPAASAKKRPVVEEEDEDDDEDDDEEDDYEEEEEEEAKPAKKHAFSRTPARSKKRPVVEDDEDDDEDDEDDEDDTEAEKLESEPKTTRFARSSDKKRRVVEEDEDEEEDEDDEDDEDDDDYEEYEPTPPRRKKSARSQSKSSGGSGIVALLLICLLAILLIIVGIIAFCNIKGGATKSKLPSFLQFNCAGKAATEQRVQPVNQQAVVPADEPDIEPTDAPVTGTQVDYSATTLKELVDSQGQPCISISMLSRPGDTVTIVLPNQDDYVVQNTENSDIPYLLTIPKSCFYPHASLSDPVYTVTPQILVTHADETQESLYVDSFDITFPTVQLELTEPAPADIPEEGIMVNENNQLMIKGKVDDHTVSVTVNGQPVANMYTGGNFEYLYTLTGDATDTVIIEASKNDYVPTSYSFQVTPYVFIPEEMTLTVETDINKLQANKNNKVTVTGTTVPGTTLTATPAAQFSTSVLCGSPEVDAEGNYSFEVTFDKSYYGIANISIHAKKDGYEESEASCIVYRMYADRNAAIKGYNKAKAYHEVPTKYKFSKVLENPTDAGFYRFVGKIDSVDPETGLIVFATKTSNKDTVNMYVLNAVSKWEPDKHVGAAYKLYCTLNGLYTDGTSVYATAWFVVKD